MAKSKQKKSLPNGGHPPKVSDDIKQESNAVPDIAELATVEQPSLRKGRKKNRTANAVAMADDSEKKPQRMEKQNGTIQLKDSADALKALPYTLGRGYTARREIFLKADPTSESSLVVANVPPFLDETAVGGLISRFATTSLVKAVVFKKSTSIDGNLQTGYRQGSVLFSTSTGPSEVLSRCEQETLCLADVSKATTSTGSEKFTKEYNEQFKPVAELREAIKATVTAYDQRISKEREEAKRKRNQPDEEGWVTVTREDKHSFRPVAQKGKVTASEEPPRKKKSSVPFYSHEAKESKLSQMRELQQKFEEDKKRLVMARAARKFNPI